jgi:aminopeptidase N
MKRFFFLGALLLPVMVCRAQSNTSDSAKHITLDTLTVSAPAGAPPYQATTPKVWELYNTRLALTFDWEGKTADVKEWIKLRPYFYAADTLVLDAKGVRIDSVLLVGKKNSSPLQYTYEQEQLTIRFGRSFTANDSVEIYLKYTAMPYKEQSGGSRAISDDRGLYFINTDHKTPNKPSEIWTQGETESNSHWMITVDKPNTRFTTQIELTVPDSCVTLSNGAMIRQVKGAKGMHTDTWRMDMPIQAYAVMFAVGNFSIIKNKWKNKDINYYVEPEFAPYAKQMFNNTAEMVGYFSQRTGVQYPWNKYSQVVVRDYVSGAMENTSASLFGEFMNENAREMADHNSEDVVSHELFHQWFGDYVTCESWSNLTVNESFANYGEQLWRGHKYGKASVDELAYNDLQGYIGTAQSHDPELVRFTYDNREQMFDGITYNKGGAILRYLNSLLGDAAFDRAMNLYLSKNALHSAEAQNWRLAVEEATGQDWSWFFNQWYYHGGHPVLKVIYAYDDTLQKLVVTVSQTQSDSIYNFRLPLKAAIIYGSERSVADWNITGRKQTFTYAYKNGVKPLVVPDYTHVLPGEIRDIKKPAQWIAQLTQTDDYVSKRLAVSAAGKQISDSTSQALLDIAFDDSLASIRRSAVAQLTRASTDKYRKRWTPKLMAMATGDKDVHVRAEAIDILSDWKATAAKPLMLHAIWDSSYLVAGNALEGINKQDKDTAYVLAKELLKTNPKTSLDAAIWTILGNKGADEDIALYKNKANHVAGGRKITFAFSLGNYLKKVKSDASFTRGVATFKAIVLRESMKSYRTAIGGALFQVAGDLKDKLTSGKKEEVDNARMRIQIVKAACEEVVAAEQDDEVKKDFMKMMKDDFETDKK